MTTGHRALTTAGACRWTADLARVVRFTVLAEVALPDRSELGRRRGYRAIGWHDGLARSDIRLTQRGVVR